LRRKRVQPVPATNQRRRRILNGLLAFAAIVLLVDALVGDKGVVERLRAKRQYEQEMSQLRAIQQENAELRETMQRLKDDPSAIESIAREELGLIRPGELLFIIRDSKPTAQ
jgi:cell division protein FtsB